MSSKRRNGIERRAHPLLDSEWGGREQEFVSIQTLGLLGESFEIEVVEDRDAERDQRASMQRKATAVQRQEVARMMAARSAVAAAVTPARRPAPRTQLGCSIIQSSHEGAHTTRPMC